jgi:hypothetical protein
MPTQKPLFMQKITNKSYQNDNFHLLFQKIQLIFVVITAGYQSDNELSL